MTTIRARVNRRFEVHPVNRPTEPWIARVMLDGKPQFRRTLVAGSHAEAMQAAYKLIADLDADLMNDVHESRAQRRADPICTECGMDVPAGTEHIDVGGTRGCVIETLEEFTTYQGHTFITPQEPTA